MSMISLFYSFYVRAFKPKAEIRKDNFRKTGPRRFKLYRSNSNIVIDVHTDK